ncbi:secreted protein, partial [mine drainage metagenome]
VPMERTATLMESLLAAPVSTAFVALAQKRFADGLQSSGLDEAMGSALRAEAVLCGDETVHPGKGKPTAGESPDCASSQVSTVANLWRRERSLR